jgi:hypothetical protein
MPGAAGEAERARPGAETRRLRGRGHMQGSNGGGRAGAETLAGGTHAAAGLRAWPESGRGERAGMHG